jgi:hypothetical protein
MVSFYPSMLDVEMFSSFFAVCFFVVSNLFGSVFANLRWNQGAAMML